jgi:hypothetical protein
MYTRPTQDAYVTPKEAEQFAWRAETGTIQSYQHIETQRALHIDGASGQFYRQDGDPITAKEALNHAMPKGQEHSHSLDVARGLQNIEIEPSIGYGHGLGM